MIGKLWQLQKLIDYSVCNKFASFVFFSPFSFVSCVGVCFFWFFIYDCFTQNYENAFWKVFVLN